MTELKQCPFCGGKVKLVTDFAQTKDPVYCFECEECGVLVYMDDLIDKDKSIEAWNNRPSPWHTGTPTENGYYLVHMTIYDEEYDLCLDFKDGTWDDRKWGFGYNYKILAYQKIEPYKED